MMETRNRRKSKTKPSSTEPTENMDLNTDATRNRRKSKRKRSSTEPTENMDLSLPSNTEPTENMDLSLNSIDVINAIDESNDTTLSAEFLTENLNLSTDTLNGINEENEANDTTLAEELRKPYNRPYSEEDDEKIINYFKANLKLLDMRNDLSIYRVLNAKYSLERSVKSLRKRFLKKILPNLFKYKVLSSSEMIDFYDAAKLEMPDEYVTMINQQTEGVMSMKSILDFIQLTNAHGMAVYIPDTVNDIPSIEMKLLNEYGIKKEFIKIIPSFGYNILKQLKQAHEGYDKLVDNFLRNRVDNAQIVSEMLPDAKKLFKGVSVYEQNISAMDESVSTVDEQNISATSDAVESVSTVDEQIILSAANVENISATDAVESVSTVDEQIIISAANNENNADNSMLITYSDIEIDHVGQIICNLSNISISQSIESLEETPNLSQIMDHVHQDEIQENFAEIITNPDENLVELNNSELVDAMLPEVRFEAAPSVDEENLSAVDEENLNAVDKENVSAIDKENVSAVDEEHLSAVNEEYLSAVENNEQQNADSMFLSTCNDSEYANVEEIISNLYNQENKENLENMSETTEKSRLSDHTYCKNNKTDSDQSSESQNLIDFACTPQIKFSKRSQSKIVRDNINVDHLMVRDVTTIIEILQQNKDKVDTQMDFDSTNNSNQL